LGRVNRPNGSCKGARMGKLVTFVSLTFVAALGGILASNFRAQSQTPDIVSTTPPIPGAAIELRDSKAVPAGHPLPEGMSLKALGDLIKLLAAQDKPLMRGAKEIAVFRQAAPAVVYLKTKEGSGSGVILQNGLILTNRHVVEGVGAVQIFFKPTDLTQDIQTAETRVGKVQFVDRRRDLAIIAPQSSLPPNYKFLKVAARDDIEIGSDVYAIGHPLGYTWTFTQGIVSGLRAIDSEDGRYTAIQTQTPINMGNSGGPLINANMEVVGINTWVRDISTLEKREIAGEQVTVSRPAQGLNFAVSARDVREFLSEVESGKFANLALQIPSAAAGCTGQWIFNGRTKSNDAGLKTLSLRCDNKVDAWQVIPDDKSKPVQFHFDPDRIGKSSIVVLSNVATGKWQVSHWDFFRDRTFAIVGRHDTGSLTPTRFEFARM
jgi:S1-C subfamily serine protease